MVKEEHVKTDWLCCPKCGGKTRTQIRQHTVLEDFPLFCGFGILCGGDVIDHSLDFRRVKNAVHTAGAEVVDGNGCGNFMTENPVQRKNGNSGFRNIHAVGVKNFLSSRFTHNE